MNLQIFTACFYPTAAPITRLADSCLDHLLSLTIYGQGETFRSWRQAKMERLAVALAESRSDVVCYSDGSDTWFMDGEREIMAQYLCYASPIVIAGERNCWPDGTLLDRFDANDGPYRYPNAGQFVGEREAVLDALNAMLADKAIDENDQSYWLRWMAAGKLPAVVDVDCRLFQTMANEKRGETFEVAGGRVRNLVTGFMPCSVHFNGGAKEPDMSDLWERTMG